MDTINSILSELLKLQGQALVLALLIGVGYLLKLTPIFPNAWIPHAIILLGAGLNPCVVGRGHVDPEVNNPLVHLVLQGFLIGIAAFALHHLVIAKIEDKGVQQAFSSLCLRRGGDFKPSPKREW